MTTQIKFSDIKRFISMKYVVDNGIKVAPLFYRHKDNFTMFGTDIPKNADAVPLWRVVNWIQLDDLSRTVALLTGMGTFEYNSPAERRFVIIEFPNKEIEEKYKRIFISEKIEF